MIKKALDEKYSYQIDENNIVHLFRGKDDCQQYLTNPLLSAIFKIETLEKENVELKEELEIQKRINKEMITSALDGIIKQFTKAKELLKKCYNTYVYEMSVRREIEQLLKEND